MRIEVGYGSGYVSAELTEHCRVRELHANNACEEDRSAVKRALDNPIGSNRLSDIVKPHEKIVIISSDITRPMPTWDVMPALLKELRRADVDMKDVTLVFALGSHRPHSEKEKRHLAGDEAYRTIKCIDSDPNDCVHLGKTDRGTPVDITRVVAEADKRICLGNVEYHYFAGYSGGAKAIMPGVSTPAAIRANHSMMTDKNCYAGNIANNPVRNDIEAALEFCPVDFIVNVVLNEQKKIAAAFAGDVIMAHREGCRFLDEMYKVPIEEKADIVIVSQGGAPKDINLYQTQKALDNAKHAVKDGGIIILVGACGEGLGQKVFEKWITEAKESEELIRRLHTDFQLGGHKAAAIAMVLQKAKVKLVSEMEPEFVRSIFLEPYNELQKAVDDATEETADRSDNPLIIVMPFGGSVLPTAVNR